MGNGDLLFWSATEYGIDAYDLTGNRLVAAVELPLLPPREHPQREQPLPTNVPFGRPLRGLAQGSRSGRHDSVPFTSRVVSLAGNATHLFALVLTEDQQAVVFSAPFNSLFDRHAGREL